VIVCVPVEVNVVCRLAVPLAKAIAVAPAGTTVTGLPICVVPLKNVTVPPGPAVLLLCDAMVAVSVTGVAVVTPVAGVAPSPVAVVAFDTVQVAAEDALGGL